MQREYVLWSRAALFTVLALASRNSMTARAQVAPFPPAAAIEPVAVSFDEPGDGHIWARGRTWKASFGTEGATYVPFLGANAPRNFPATFALDAADAGGAALDVSRGVAPTRVGDAVEFRRGAVVERYDFALDGVEQTFHVRARPTAGELRLAIAVESELEPALDARGLHLRNEWGGVDVSNAVAIDARGRRADLAWNSHAGGFELRVPADFLAAATLPVVVDPWISTFALDASAGLDRVPDVCLLRGDASGTVAYMVAWERTVSALDSDLWWGAFDSNGQYLPTTGAWADITSLPWAKPRLASIPSAHQAGLAVTLLVSQVGTPASGRKIYGRMRDATSVLTPQFQITESDAYDHFDPVVGASDYSSGTDFCVVWQRVYSPTDSDIHARLVAKDGSLGIGTIVVDNSIANDGSPAISRALSGAAASWNVVWEREYSPTDRDVYGAEVNWAGGVSRPTFAIDVSGSDDSHLGVSVRDANDDYVVVYERALAGGDADVVAAVMRGGATQGVAQLSLLDGSRPGCWQGQPEVERDANRILVAYSELPSPSATYADVMLSTFGLVAGPSLELTEGHVALATTARHEYVPRIACEWSGGYVLPTRAMAVYGINDVLANLDDIGGALYELPIPGFLAFCAGDGLSGLPTTPCPCGNYGAAGNGCANSVQPAGAHLAATGVPLVDDVVLWASGMPPTSSCIYLQGDALDDVVFGDGVRCVGGMLLRLRTRANVGGASSFPDSTDTVTLAARGGVTPGSGDRRFYQVYYRNAAAAFCPPATFNVTNGRRIDW